MRLLADRALEPSGESLDKSELPESVQALIAARLDTLSPERKSLLQDAAVLGKVFWLGALAEIGGRDPSDLELAPHDLARKERDVAYSQIPRVERIRRHRGAATWIERQAGARVEDLAEVLSHHYLQALELAQAAGDRDQADELTAPARRFLTLAGERALGLDTIQAEARLARALELTPPDDIERPALLVHWADAVFQAGHPLEAAEALDEALDSFRARGETEATARALQLRSRLALRLGEGRLVALAAEAVALLERGPPGSALVAAYAQLANAHAIASAYAEAIEAAEQAVTHAETLGLPEPARALGYRGYARALIGDADGLAEMERALPLLVERGAGRDAATLKNNLALARYPLQGPPRSLSDFEQAIAFCEQRGLADSAAGLEANCPGLLAELGRAEEALERAGRLAANAEARGDTRSLIELRSVELANRLARDEHEASSAGADWLAETAQEEGTAEMLVLGLVAAAAALADATPQRAHVLLSVLEEAAGTRETTYFLRQLTAMTRTALVLGDPALAQRFAEGLERRYPLDEHALYAARAQLAEHTGDGAHAATLYAEAAVRWQQFGNVTERAHAFLVKAAAYSPPNLLLHSGRFSKHVSCSQGWATSRRSP